jgi:hypothetical protein
MNEPMRHWRFVLLAGGGFSLLIGVWTGRLVPGSTRSVRSTPTAW